MKHPVYVIVSPVRNEEKYLPGTIRCMAASTVRPKQWVLVDDGSTDGSAAVLDQAASQYDWITVVHRQDRGFRQAGTGVINAFYDGFTAIRHPDWDYLVKFDGDLSFSEDYFERCFRKFAAEPKLGIGGGTICNEREGVLMPESKIDPLFHVRGATKIYRRECWDQIGGLIRAPGWDTVDEVKANMLGWTTRTFPDIKLLHHRIAGAAYGRWSNWVKGGRAAYVSGYHPLFMFLKCCRRLFEPPRLVGGCGLFVGFFEGYIKGSPRVEDEALIRYFRQQQFNRLLGRPNLWSIPQATNGDQSTPPPAN